MKQMICLLLLSACSPGQNAQDVAQVREKNAPLPGPSIPAPQPTPGEGEALPGSGVDETADMPKAVAGAALTCAIRKEAAANALETEIGCRLESADKGEKLPYDPLLSFSSNRPEQVATEAQEASSLYHVLYRIHGSSVEAIRQTAEGLEAIALYRQEAVRTEQVYKVLKPAIVLNDFEAPIVREQSIDPDAPGSY